MKIGLVGFFGNNNLGDEAILRAMISQFKKYHQPIQIVVFTDSLEATKEKYNVIVFSRKRLSHLVAGINYCDIIVFAGGSLFQDQTSLLNMFYYAGLVRLSKIYRKKVILYSQGFDQLNKFLSRIILKRTLLLADRISARDYKSIHYVKDVLKVKKNVRFVMDTALFLQPYQKDNKLNNSIGINLMKGNLTKNLLNSLISFQQQTNLKFFFIPFNPEDKGVYKVLRSKLNIEILEEDDYCTIVGYIKQLEMFIGQRYHSLIGSASARTPFIYLGDADKGVGFAGMVKQGTILNLEQNFSEKMLSFYKNRVASKNVLSCVMEEIERKSIPELIGNILLKYDEL